jgi:predicted AAA+ superfamily ATPase
LSYLERWISPNILKSVKTYPVVVLTGARQVGKSTFLRHAPALKNWLYLTLDDFDVLETAQSYPKALLSGNKNIIIDEIQKAPRLLPVIKQEVDKGYSNRHFLLSGSANLLLMHKVSESLAGRAVYYVMRPFTIGEIMKKAPLQCLDRLFSGISIDKKRTIIVRDGFEEFIIRGFFPPSVLRFKELSEVIGWLEGFVATFLERDLRQFAQITNLPDFRRLMGMLALRNGQMLNQSEISRDVNIPQPTVHRYINLLETSFLLDKVYTYAVNRTKRLIKTPKIYWNDTGLACFLMGHHYPKDLINAREKGALFETLVFHHLKVWASLKIPSPKIFYWRTATGQEVDFVIEWGNKLIALEIKSSHISSYSDTKNLRIFMNEYPETLAGIVVYAGGYLKRLGENIWAIPWEMLV